MARETQVQTNFTAGLWTPRLFGRADQQRYHNALEVLDNFIIMPHGGAIRRSGTRFVEEVKDSSRFTRLIPFQFSVEQTYMLEFGHQYVRFYRDRARISDGPAPLEIVSPYSEGQLRELKFTQSADVLFICHPDVKPQELRRLADTVWKFVDFDFQDGPYLKINTDPDCKVKVSANTGLAITITSDSKTITAGSFANRTATVTVGAHNFDVGSDIAISGVDPVGFNGDFTITAVTADTVSYDLDTDPGAFVTGGLLHCPGFKFSDVGRLIRIKVATLWGYASITAFTDPSNVTADVREDFDGTPGTFTSEWRLGAWSETTGFPFVPTFHQGRLWFGGTNSQPQTLWASVVASFNDFQPSASDDTVADDDGVTFTINDDNVNAIRWILSGLRGLAIGTSGGEFILQSRGAFDPITPTTIATNRQTANGSTVSVRPYQIGQVILYVQRGGRVVNEYAFSFDADQFITEEVSLLAESITSAPIVDAAFQLTPWRTYWAVLDDGKLVGLTYLRSQNVVAWQDHPIGGTNVRVESVAVIPEDPFDQVWLIVERRINGACKRFVEFIEDRFEIGEDPKLAFYVDSGLSRLTGAPTDTVSGLDHLEGETVQVLADGATHKDVVVTGGSVTLDVTATVIHVGLGTTAKLRTMPAVPPRAPLDPRGKEKSLYKVFLQLHQTIGARVNVLLDQEFLEDEELVLFRDPSVPMDQGIPLFTGMKEVSLPTSNARNYQVEVIQPQPLPITLLSIIQEFDIGGV